ncbi:hypothetical protein [Jatrophihabitans sp.]|jgi:hypothetical protein|uniref:hypothetical protein n=1 Tax=Jatrophihabitans sp. TaxID=1932789 RepID=UPI002EEE4DF6
MTKNAAWLAAVPVLVVLVLAGCGGSSSKSAAPASSSTGSAAASTASSTASVPVSSTPAPGFASTSAGTPKGVLSKPDFLIEMNKLCSSVDAQIKALPRPTAATDYAVISTNLTGTLKLVPSFISRAEALVRQTAERAALEKNWLAIQKSDFAAFKPVAERMLAHSKAHDAAKVQADANAVSALPDHTSRLVSYLNGYGLSSCAQLESE